MIEDIDSKQEVYQIYAEPDAPSADDYRKGYVAPTDLACPNHPTVKAAAQQTKAPSYVLAGIKKYRRDQEYDLGTSEIKAHRLRHVAAHHLSTTLVEMREAHKRALADYNALEEKRLTAHEPPRVELQTRLNQIRSELQAMEPSERVAHIGQALRNNDAEILQAIANFPLNERVCPKQFHWKAVQKHESNFMKNDGPLHQDLLTVTNALETAIQSMESELVEFGASQRDAGEAIFKQALKADFKGDQRNG